MDRHDKYLNKKAPYIDINWKTKIITSSNSDGRNLCKASHLADMTLKLDQTTHSIVRSTENLLIPFPEM